MRGEYLREVPAAIQVRADKCRHGLSCLKDGAHPLCEVVCKVATGVLSTYCPLEPPCPYCQPAVRSEGFCVCPVRIELYERYGI